MRGKIYSTAAALACFFLSGCSAIEKPFISLDRMLGISPSQNQIKREFYYGEPAEFNLAANIRGKSEERRFYLHIYSGKIPEKETSIREPKIKVYPAGLKQIIEKNAAHYTYTFKDAREIGSPGIYTAAWFGNTEEVSTLGALVRVWGSPLTFPFIIGEELIEKNKRPAPIFYHQFTISEESKELNSQ